MERLIIRFKTLMSYFAGDGYYTESDFQKSNNELKNYMIKELEYWISCCYEGGHTLNDELLCDDVKIRNTVKGNIKKSQKLINDLIKVE